MRFAKLCLIGAIALLTVLPLSAQRKSSNVTLGVRTGVYFDPTDLLLGAEILVPLASSLYLNPNIEYVLVDGGTMATFNMDGHYDLPVGGTPYLWVGGGLGLVYVDPDGPVDGEIHPGLDILFGIGFDAGPVIPYSQFKAFVGDDSMISIAFGLRF